MTFDWSQVTWIWSPLMGEFLLYKLNWLPSCWDSLKDWQPQVAGEHVAAPLCSAQGLSPCSHRPFNNGSRRSWSTRFHPSTSTSTTMVNPVMDFFSHLSYASTISTNSHDASDCQPNTTLTTRSERLGDMGEMTTTGTRDEVRFFSSIFSILY